MEKRFTLDAGKHLGEIRRFSGESIDEKIIDDLIGQLYLLDSPAQDKQVAARVYKHSMFAPKAIKPGDLESLRNRTPGIARLGQGLEGVVEIFSGEENGFCVKRRYGIGDRKERKKDLRTRYTFKKEFELQKRAFELGVTVPRPLAYTEVAVLNSSQKRIADLSTEFLTMETIPGQTLLEFDPNQVADLPALKKAFDTYKEDIETLHRNDIYHGDMGLKNIMIVVSSKAGTVAYTIYLIDFGRAYIAKQDMFANHQVPGAKSDDELYEYAYAKFCGA